MKLKLLTAFLPALLSTFLPAWSQETEPVFSREFGLVTDYELAMTRYDRDTTAAAVVIYDDSSVYYDYKPDSQIKVELVMEVSVKIKILKQEAVGVYADVSLPYNTADSGNRESISAISAASYNLEDGRVVRTEMSDDYIFTEQVMPGVGIVKFSIPEVRVGSVIEYRYTYRTDRLTHIPEFDFQMEIPEIYCHAHLEIPEFLQYAMLCYGDHPVRAEQTAFVKNVLFRQSQMALATNVYDYVAENVPALTGEDFVWNAEQYRTRIVPSLVAVLLPGQPGKVYELTWGGIDKVLDEAGFKAGFKYKNPYAKNVDKLFTEDEDRIRAIHTFVMNAVKWNGTYSCLPSNMSDVIKYGMGNSADINFLLISALEDAGYEAVPVLLKLRSMGEMPIAHPTTEDINTFVVMVRLPSGETVFLDGTDRQSTPNVLPAKMRVSRARIYGGDEYTGWVCLNDLGDNTTTINISGSVDSTGLFSGQAVIRYTDVDAMDKRKEVYGNGTEKYLDELEMDGGMEVEDYEMEVSDGGDCVVETYKLKKRFASTGDGLVMMNACIMPIVGKNPFTDPVRTLPVEFDAAERIKVQCSVTLPEGYTVDQMPENIRCDAYGSLKYVYMGRAVGNIFTSMSELSIGEVVYGADKYEGLRDFFGRVAGSCNDMVIIGKSL